MENFSAGVEETRSKLHILAVKNDMHTELTDYFPHTVSVRDYNYQFTAVYLSRPNRALFFSLVRKENAEEHAPSGRSLRPDHPW
jgi:hypothetical protein